MRDFLQHLSAVLETTGDYTACLHYESGNDCRSSSEISRKTLVFRSGDAGTRKIFREDEKKSGNVTALAEPGPGQ